MSFAVPTELVDPPWGNSMKLITAHELRRDLLIYAGVELQPTQFYVWLKWAYVKPLHKRKLVYSQHDRFLLLKFATEFRPKYPTLKAASIAFFEDYLQKEQDYGNSRTA